MIHSVRFTVVLDTNVVYPVIIRDILFWFAYYDLYTPKWSEQIFEEWKKVMKEKGVSEEEANKRTEKANSAFPDALVKNYKVLIEHLNQEQAIAAFKEMVLNKKNPKMDEFDVLNQLRNAGLKDTANYLHTLL